MPDNARDIIRFLAGRHLTPEEAERIVLAARRRVRYAKPQTALLTIPKDEPKS